MCSQASYENLRIDAGRLAPPQAQRVPRDVSVHGDPRVDDYFWLRERNNPGVLEYLRDENAYTEQVMAPTKPLQEALVGEFLGRMQETDTSAAHPKGAWLYYTRTQKGLQYPVHCRRPRSGAASETVLLDLNALASGQAFIGLGDFSVSDDGHRLAYSVDRTGYRDFELEVRDLRTGSPVPQRVGAVSSVAWAADNDTLFFTKEDPVSKRSFHLGRCRLSTGQVEAIWEETDPLFSIALGRSMDGRYLFCSSVSKLTSEVRSLRSDEPDGAWQVLNGRRDGHRYFAEHRAGHFYFTTNKDAGNYRVATAPVATPDESHWVDFVPADPRVKIDSLALFERFAVLVERQDGLTHLRVFEFATGRSHRVSFDEPAYEAGLSANAEFEAQELRFSYESPVTPPSIYAYDMAARTRTLVKRQEVLGGYDGAAYACERVLAPASDGTPIPVTLVYRRELRTAAAQRLLLTGYGSYGHSLRAGFSFGRLSLLDRGVICALAHIRGGGELGEPWREAGRMKAKATTFTDFIACAEFLVTAGYTEPRRLAATGRSAGGLLMGAVLNLRPDLFASVVAEVPFVDVLNTMLDASLPLTTAEYIEWGNPQVPEEYLWMRAYSPYDNLRAQAYPAVLVTTAINDSQVPYWEGAKFVAKLRTLSTGTAPSLLKVHLEPAGHGGASGRYDALRDLAFVYAFLLGTLA